MYLVFLGTGGAWGLPELNCDCFICRQMRRKNERRQRTALLLQGAENLLVDCGPDIAAQLTRHHVPKPDAVLITHEHGDHYIGLDELFSFKRTAANREFTPIPVYLTAQSRQPQKETFLVHIGDADGVPDDPANHAVKKKSAANPMKSPLDGRPYPIPLDHDQWQVQVNQIIRDYNLPYKITVAHDDLVVKLK